MSHVDNFKLTTKRLILRPHNDDDAFFMIELNSDPEVIKHTADKPTEGVIQALKIIKSLREQFVTTGLGRLVVIEKKSKNKLGWCGLKWLEDAKAVEVGYRFFRNEWNKGFATEASEVCLEYGFKKLDLDKIIARVAPLNVASARVAEKLGMKKVFSGTENGGWEFDQHEITREEFAKRH